jgi:hypothetical protein
LLTSLLESSQTAKLIEIFLRLKIGLLEPTCSLSNDYPSKSLFNQKPVLSQVKIEEARGFTSAASKRRLSTEEMPVEAKPCFRSTAGETSGFDDQLPSRLALSPHHQDSPNMTLLWLSYSLIRDRQEKAISCLKNFQKAKTCKSRASHRPHSSEIPDSVKKHLKSALKPGQSNRQVAYSSKQTQINGLFSNYGLSSSRVLSKLLHRLYLATLEDAWSSIVSSERTGAEPCGSLRSKNEEARLSSGYYLPKARWPSQLQKEPITAGAVKPYYGQMAEDRLAYGRFENSTLRQSEGKIKALFSKLVISSREKLRTCFQRMSSLTNRRFFDNNEEVLPRMMQLSDLKILKSLHNHWLSIMQKNGEPGATRNYPEFCRRLAAVLERRISHLGTVGFYSIKEMGGLRQIRLHASLRLVERCLHAKLKNSFRKLQAVWQKANLQRMVLKAYKDFQKTTGNSYHTMTPSRIALLAKFFGTEKLIKTVNKRLISAFHSIRRHSAVESYRGFYSQWWKWKICHLKAKHHTEIRNQQRELSEEKSLRMQTDDRLTKWMSNTSCRGVESQGKLTERGDTGFFFPKKEPQLVKLEQTRQGPRLIFSPKKLNKRSSVSNSMDSRAELQRAGSVWQAANTGKSNEIKSSTRVGYGKTISLERGAKAYQFYPANEINNKIRQPSGFKLVEPTLRFNLNISDISKVRQVHTSSLVDHFKLKIKDSRADFLGKTASFRESSEASKTLRLDFAGRTSPLQRLFRNTEESSAIGSLTERLDTETRIVIKGYPGDSQLEVSQASTSRPFHKTPRQMFETSRTRDPVPSTGGRKPTLLELWTDRRLKNH